MSLNDFRKVGPLVTEIRAFLMGRYPKNSLRFQPQVAPRPGPEANLPEGCSHKVAANYYFTRDGRREVMPDKVLADNTASGAKLALSAGEAEGAGSAVQSAKAGKPRTPGKYFNYSP